MRVAASELEIGLGRALVLHESARRSTDSRGPEAEIDHLGSFREAKWPGREPIHTPGSHS